MAFGDTIASGQNSSQDNTSPYEVTVTISPTATSGNLLVAVGAFSASEIGSYSTPSGWNLGTTVPSGSIPPDPTRNMQAYWVWKISDGSETSVTLGMTGSSNATVRGAYAEFEGPWEASPLDQTAENEANIASIVTSQPSGTTGTTAQADELAVAFFGMQSAGNVDTGRAYTNSFTEVIFASAASSPGRAGAAIAKRVLTATGTYSTTFSTTDTGEEMYGAIGTFKKQAAAGGFVPFPRPRGLDGGMGSMSGGMN